MESAQTPTSPEAPTGLPRYDCNPTYPVTNGHGRRGWSAALGTLPEAGVRLAVDGPAIARWADVVSGIRGAFEQSGALGELVVVDALDAFPSWDEFVGSTSSLLLQDDPYFDRLPTSSLADLLDGGRDVERPEHGIVLVLGPGAALHPHDVLWYVDLPKRYAEAAVGAGEARNLGQREGVGSTKRLFYVDWPLQDAHRDAIVPAVDVWLDVQDTGAPVFLDGETLRDSAARLAGQPFRTRPTFNTTSWGGIWGRDHLGHNPGAESTGLGYELIGPESGVLLGEGTDVVEVPFQLLVALHPLRILGEAVHRAFGTSFPIRFDYLDTLGGDNLSVHVHPRPDYMAEQFGWPYAQHETYYVVVGSEDNHVFLGLREGVDLGELHREATRSQAEGRSLDVFSYVQTFPAVPHQLFVIPAGTPHGSGKGNVVLEVSATPYLYSLRLWDWLRTDGQGRPRPLHVDRAMANVDPSRQGAQVAERLVAPARTLRSGDGWAEEMLGDDPDMFFEVRRVRLSPERAVRDDTEGRFHVLNVVSGGGVRLVTDQGVSHSLACAETLVVPASVGGYVLHALGSAPVLVVKALVR